MRSEADEYLIYAIREDILLGQLAGDGIAVASAYRMDFEEPVPMIGAAVPIVPIRRSVRGHWNLLVVYPAAGLIDYVLRGVPKFIVDKKIPYTSALQNLTTIEQPASIGIGELS